MQHQSHVAKMKAFVSAIPIAERGSPALQSKHNVTLISNPFDTTDSFLARPTLSTHKTPKHLVTNSVATYIAYVKYIQLFAKRHHISNKLSLCRNGCASVLLTLC